MARPKKPTGAAAVGAAAAAAAVEALRGNNGNVVDFILRGDEDEDEDRLSGDLLEDLEKIDESHGGGITWELYCDVPLDRSGQICRLQRSELRDLRNRCLEFGAGEYHVVARAATGKFVTGTRRNIKISGLARGPAPAAAPTGSAAIDPIAFLTMAEERAERRRAEERRQRMEQIKFWAPILAPIGVEMAKGLFGRAAGGESVKDLVAALVSMKQLNGDTNQVDTLLKGIELAQSLQPDSAGPKGSSWPDLIATGMREARPLIESLTNRKAAAPAAPAAAAATQLRIAPVPPTAAGSGGAAHADTAPPAGAPAAGAEADMFAMFEPLLRKLAGELEEYAVNATDPDLTAEALLAKIPRMVKAQIPAEQLLGWMNDPNWWQLLSDFHPPLRPYQAYCDQVREAIIYVVEHPNGEEAPPETGEAS